MVIVCSTDNNYVMPLGVMLCSLFENNKDENIKVHILAGNVSVENKENLSHLASKYSRIIVFHDMDDRDFADFPVGKSYQLSSISLATYYRLFLTKVLPETVDKVLYMDCDIIVRHSLSTLWNTDISDYAIAGVLDPESNMPFAYNRLKYPQSAEYINAGLLLINLDYWRKTDALSRFYAIASNKDIQLNFHDQDILNLCFYKEKKKLSFKYNFQNDFLYKPQFIKLNWVYWHSLEEEANDPVIIHFIYRDKPWFVECTHPYKNEFIKYYSKTQWGTEPLKKLYRHRFMKRIIAFLRYTYHGIFPKPGENLFREKLNLK